MNEVMENKIFLHIEQVIKEGCEERNYEFEYDGIDLNSPLAFKKTGVTSQFDLTHKINEDTVIFEEERKEELFSNEVNFVNEEEQRMLSLENLKQSDLFMLELENLLNEDTLNGLVDDENNNNGCTRSNLIDFQEIEHILNGVSVNKSSYSCIDPALFDIDSGKEIFPFLFNNINDSLTQSSPVPSQIIQDNNDSDCDSYESSKTSQSKPKFYSRSGQIADPNRGPCANCKTTLTCYWRKLKGQYHCNACTLFFKRNKCHRSVQDLNKPIKRRNRKSKYAAFPNF